jgi:hypothetical protein
LFGLDSGLAFGGDIEEIANFLGREVEEVRRKASERGRSTTQPEAAGPRPAVRSSLG